MFTREIVEFSSHGLDQLEAEVKSTGNAVEDLRKKNAALRKALTDGTWQREAKALTRARGELKLYANEQQRLQNIAKRQAFDQRFGRFGGVAYHASRMRGAAGSSLGMASAGFSGMIGTAGMFGAALGAGALISRGFSGTSAAARLDMEIEKLSRTVAEKLLPVMSALTNNISRINQASDRTRAGTATFGDRVMDAATDPVNLIGAYLGYKGLQRFGGGTARAGIGRIAGGFAAGTAGRAVMMNPATALFAGSAWMFGQGFASHSYEQRYDQLSKRTYGRDGKAKFHSPLTGEEQQRFEYLIRNYAAAGDQGKDYLRQRREYASERLAEVEKKIADHRPSRSIYNPMKVFRGFGNAATGGWEDERQKWMMERNVIDRLRAGEQLNAGGGMNSLMLQVQGAGERRGLTDLHQELAEQIAQKIGVKQGEGDTLVDRIVNSINVLVNIGNSLLGVLGSNERHSVMK